MADVIILEIPKSKLKLWEGEPKMCKGNTDARKIIVNVGMNIQKSIYIAAGKSKKTSYWYNKRIWLYEKMHKDLIRI